MIASATNHSHASEDVAGDTVTPMLGTNTGTGPSTGWDAGALGTATGGLTPAGLAAGGRLTCTGTPGRLTPWTSAMLPAEDATRVATDAPLLEGAVAEPGAVPARTEVAEVAARALPGAEADAPGPVATRAPSEPPTGRDRPPQLPAAASPRSPQVLAWPATAFDSCLRIASSWWPSW